MSVEDEKIKYLIDKLEKIQCPTEELVISLTTTVWKKAYNIFVKNPDISYEDYCNLMDMNYIKFAQDFYIDNTLLLVRFYDHENENYNHEIYQWLNEHGFGSAKGFWGCNWVFIDLVNKKYYPGRQGVQYAKPYKGHSINDDEFYTIMHILEHYDEMTEIEYRIINFIFNRKYKSIFEPVRLSNYEMKQTIIPILDKMNAWKLVTSWSCHNTNIKRCYKLLLENPDISLEHYKEKSGWNKKRNGSAGIYSS